ncbi:MAG: pacearchaeosortase [Nanoarchaeota archaeon]
MKKSSNEILSIFYRYLLLIALPLGGLWLFYFVFTPLTVYPVYFLFNYFFGATLDKTTVYVGLVPIELIKACIAGSAYYLLLIFNLSTPNIKINQRLKMLFFAFLIFLVVNILRIFVLGILYMAGSPLFDIIHRLSWYAGSVALIVAIWFYQVKAYKLKEIPAYSDLKFLYRNSLLTKRK